MNKKELMVKAHKMVKEIRNKYPEIDYKFQLGLCLTYLYEEETKKENIVSEIELQVNDLKKLIGKKVFVKRYSYDDYYYNDSDKVETFTIDDFKCYSDDIKAGDIELWDIVYTGKSSDYYLITFKDLIFIC